MIELLSIVQPDVVLRVDDARQRAAVEQTVGEIRDRAEGFFGAVRNRLDMMVVEGMLGVNEAVTSMRQDEEEDRQRLGTMLDDKVAAGLNDLYALNHVDRLLYQTARTWDARFSGLYHSMELPQASPLRLPLISAKGVRVSLPLGEGGREIVVREAELTSILAYVLSSTSFGEFMKTGNVPKKLLAKSRRRQGSKGSPAGM